MHSKSWLTHQLESMKKATRKYCRIFLPLASQNQGPWHLLKLFIFYFYIVAFSPEVHVAAGQTSLSPMIPQSKGDHPLALRTALGQGPLTITLPLHFLQDIHSGQHLDQAACFQAKPGFPLHTGTTRKAPMD